MHNFFYGWYFKCQSKTQTLAIIPAIHRAGQKGTCSIQIITENQAWNVDYPAAAFHWTGKDIWIGKNRFGVRGLLLAIHTPELDIRGKLMFGPLFPLKYDIMGPFSLLPFLECRHCVRSMKHSVSGKMFVNGQEYLFQDAIGYWEGDQGYSFPKEYAWTQCSFPGGALMLSVADVPIAGFHFRGIIGVVLWKGREYRLATYLGAKAVQVKEGKLRIVQGNLELEARLLEKVRCPLKAPDNGNMMRTIHENVACRAYYRFKKGEYTFFSFKTDRASFEYEL
jgi:hypothetical protein